MYVLQSQGFLSVSQGVRCTAWMMYLDRGLRTCLRNCCLIFELLGWVEELHVMLSLRRPLAVICLDWQIEWSVEKRPEA